MLRSRRFALAAFLAALAASANPLGARAGVPSPGMSYEDPCLIACPAGDSTFVVITRHADGVPWNHDPVSLSFCDCPRFHLRPGTFSYEVGTSGCLASELPETDGTSRFPIAGGGVCGDSVRMDAGGVFLGLRSVASPDQDGDLVVTVADLQIVQAKLQSGDATADFDCDGMVTDADVAITLAHLGHGAVPTDVPPGPRSLRGLGFSRSPSPNPARGTVFFAIVVPGDQRVDLSVHDLAGRRVATLWRGVLPGGEHGFVWNGMSDEGRPRRAGLYVVSVRAGATRVTKQVALIE